MIKNLSLDDFNTILIKVNPDKFIRPKWDHQVNAYMLDCIASEEWKAKCNHPGELNNFVGFLDLMMGDVCGGSSTPSMVKKVLEWQKSLYTQFENATAAGSGSNNNSLIKENLWTELEEKNRKIIELFLALSKELQITKQVMKPYLDTQITKIMIRNSLKGDNYKHNIIQYSKNKRNNIDTKCNITKGGKQEPNQSVTVVARPMGMNVAQSKMMTTSKNNIVNSNIGQKKIAAAGNDNKSKSNGEKEKKVKLHTIGISPDTAQQMMTSMDDDDDDEEEPDEVLELKSRHLFIDVLCQHPSSKWSEVEKLAERAKAVADPVQQILMKLAVAFRDYRQVMKRMGDAAGVQIEPDEQTKLCDATLEIPGVLTAGVPGAGGQDAIFAIVLCQETRSRVQNLWMNWNADRKVNFQNDCLGSADTIVNTAMATELENNTDMTTGTPSKIQCVTPLLGFASDVNTKSIGGVRIEIGEEETFFGSQKRTRNE